MTGSAPGRTAPGSIRTALRIIGMAEAAAGAALTLRPATIAALAGGAPPPTWIVRVLGARMLAQGVVEFVRPEPVVAMGGAAVDASHALSMVPVIVASRRFRRSALASAGMAGATAAVLLGAFVRATSRPDV